MQRFLGLALLMVLLITFPTWANSSSNLISTVQSGSQTLHVAYPLADHKTTAKQIFLIGSAPSPGSVLVNGEGIDRSPQGHFAPSFPLRLGENLFTLRYQDQELKVQVTREAISSPLVGAAFGQDSLWPAVNIARLPSELICFAAVAPENALVSVKVDDRIIPLQRQTVMNLPANSGVLTGLTQPTSDGASQYAGCATANSTGELGKPQYLLNMKGSQIAQTAPGKIRILSPTQLEIAEVIVPSGTARTGASTDYSRLTPLPKGTRATITGQEGDWVRLDYGGWINRKEVKISAGSVPVRSLIRGITSRQANGWTEVLFPLQVPVPITVEQGQNTFKLTLHNTTAQTDTIRLTSDRVISRLDWQQTEPGKVEYTFSLKSSLKSQWGYKLRYEGTTLILSLRHPPHSSLLTPHSSLSGFKILLDPGHGGPEDFGARGGTGYPEKEVALLISKALRNQLIERGATVFLTREADIDLLPNDRVTLINKLEPTIALSLHYNALPDDGDAINTKGVAAFWYNAQAYDLAAFLHDHLVKTLDRPSYGVFWNNLALTRPTVAPSVLLELGFMINPIEFEWITDPQSQQKLVLSLADGITKWLTSAR
ncbi:N-acetylmuramoyl-L-alanine amidase [Phormidesmis priestleyi]